MNPQELKEFLKSIKDTDIEEMEYRKGESSLYFKKSAVEIVEPEVKEVVENKKEEEEMTLVAIKSTMVGTFANAQSNDKTPFVKEGDEIVVGQKIGQIEAMKIIKDVHSNVKGKVLKIMVLNDQAVEYGQEMFLIDTSKNKTAGRSSNRIYIGRHDV